MRLKLYYKYYIRYLMISKHLITNHWEIPKIKQLDLKFQAKKKDKEIIFWYSYMLLGQKPKFVIRHIKKSITRKQKNLVNFLTNYKENNALIIIEKLLNFLIAYRTHNYILYVKNTKMGSIPWNITDFTTYNETEQIYNDTENIVIDNIRSFGELKTNCHIGKYNETLLRMLQFPIKLITRSH